MKNISHLVIVSILASLIYLSYLFMNFPKSTVKQIYVTEKEGKLS